VDKLLSDSTQQHEAQERDIEEKLRRGFELLTNTQAYNNEIMERPDTVIDWNNAVEKGTLAFWYRPKAGDDKGKTFLVFKADTLKKLIRRVGCTDELYEPFLKRCEGRDILDSRDRTINLKGSFNGITFDVERF